MFNMPVSDIHRDLLSFSLIIHNYVNQPGLVPAYHLPLLTDFVFIRANILRFSSAEGESRMAVRSRTSYWRSQEW